MRSQRFKTFFDKALGISKDDEMRKIKDISVEAAAYADKMGPGPDISANNLTLFFGGPADHPWNVEALRLLVDRFLRKNPSHSDGKADHEAQFAIAKRFARLQKKWHNRQPGPDTKVFFYS